jgi:hypothetical protein
VFVLAGMSFATILKLIYLNLFGNVPFSIQRTATLQDILQIDHNSNTKMFSSLYNQK